MSRILRIALSVLVAAAACFAVRSHYFFNVAKAEYAFCATLLSVSVLYLRIRPSFKELAVLILSTLVLVGVSIGVGPFPPSVRICLALFGVAGFAALAARTIWSKPSEITIPLCAFIAAVCLVGSGWIIPPFLKWAGQGMPKVLDLYLVSFDASLGFQPSFAVGTLFFKWPLFDRIAGVFYMGVPFIVALVFGDRLLRDMRKAFLAFLAFLLVGPVGSLFYTLFPAVGPVFVFPGNFPVRPIPGYAVRALILEPIAINGYRNAMPSLHMAWAILGLWYSRGMAWWIRAIAWMFFVFTVFATLGMGEHYLIDLIVAFPFSLMVFAVFYSVSGWGESWRIRAITFGFGATILWMTLLRFQPNLFWLSPVIPWGLIVLTVAATLVLKRKMELASEPVENAVTGRSVADLPAEL